MKTYIDLSITLEDGIPSDPKEMIPKIEYIYHELGAEQMAMFIEGIDHAMYMAEEFNKRGIKSVYLTGQNSAEEREHYIKRLECEEVK